jgi:hypothetical protein
MSASQNNVSLVLNQQDANGTNIINRLIGAIAYAGVVGEFRDGIFVTAQANALTLPTTNILQFYFKNTHATAICTVTVTVQGGSAVIASKVQPGGVFVNWCASTSSTAGYTAITITNDVANATFEMFLGG